MPATSSKPLRHFTACALTAAALASLVACGDKSAPAANAPAAAAPAANPATAAAPTAPAPAAAPVVDTSAKLNVYIECYNASHERGHKAWERYASWVKDINAGPTGNEKVIYGVYTVGEPALAKCDKPLLDAAAAKPALPELDGAAKGYADSLKNWAQTLVEADKYYNRQDYKDDQMAKGKAMHPDIVKQYAAYKDATKALSNALEAESDKQQLAQLAKVEKEEGRKFTYWHMSTMLAAKQMVNLLSEDEFDIAAANDKIKAFDDAAAGLQAFAKEPGAQVPSMLSMLNFEELVVKAKQRVRRYTDKTPYTKGEQMSEQNGTGWTVQGSADAVVHQYNELVKASNNLR